MIPSNNLHNHIEQHRNHILDQLRATLPPSEQQADEASDDMKQKQAQAVEEWAAAPSTLELIRSAVMCEQVISMYPRNATGEIDVFEGQDPGNIDIILGEEDEDEWEEWEN